MLSVSCLSYASATARPAECAGAIRNVVAPPRASENLGIVEFHLCADAVTLTY